MRVTGYMLREAIKQQELKSESAASRFPNTLRKFPNEDIESPVEVAQQLLSAEKNLAKLRTAQAEYNLAVIFNSGISLAEAVKQLIGYGKIEKLWKDLATVKRNRYEMASPSERDPNMLVSVPTITNKQCTDLARDASKIVARLRQDIAVANAREVDIEDLDPALFE